MFLVVLGGVGRSVCPSRTVEVGSRGIRLHIQHG
jgi:hypothetical protein